MTAEMMGRGRLVLVSTPIGNLGDLSPRAIESLQRCGLICCEDTRHSGKLLSHAGVHGVRLAVTNEHTETERVDDVLATLSRGLDVAVVTDAGTPGISDPGARLVRAVLDAGFGVSAVPGPAALVMALVVSGLDTTRFVFEGFVPRSGGDRTARLADVATERRTVVLYEAPHRVARTVADLRSACGDERRVVLARELTKLHEDVWRGTLADAVRHLDDIEPRGEYVIVLEGAPAAPPADDDAIVTALRVELDEGADRRAAIAAVMAATGAPKRRVYDLALTIPRSTATPR
ncbi:MAG: 16S rRNA (cytidine(1402)-2'-O)-methyltransferase [Ilumatobacteraceae bacterium]